VGDTVDGIAAQSKVNDAMTFTVSDFLGTGMNDGNIEEVRNHESDESDEWKKGDWRLEIGDWRLEIGSLLLRSLLWIRSIRSIRGSSNFSKRENWQQIFLPIL